MQTKHYAYLFQSEEKELISVMANGDIFIKERFIENNKELADEILEMSKIGVKE